jgi:hypothetical protein
MHFSIVSFSSRVSQLDRHSKCFPSHHIKQNYHRRGGIGGLAIAHSLRKHSIQFHIYKRDNGKDYRAQGYRIRVARDVVASLQWLFNKKTWSDFELTCGETKLVPAAEIDAATARVCETPNADASLPKDAAKPYTVDRTMFRKVMLLSLGKHIS